MAVVDPDPGPFSGFDVARFARYAEWHVLDFTERDLRVLGEENPSNKLAYVALRT